MQTNRGFESCKHQKAQRDWAMTFSAGQQPLFSRGSYQGDESDWLYLHGAAAL